MVRTSTAVATTAGALLAGVVGWTLYQQWTTLRVLYTVVDHVGDVEVRRYPPSILVETTASSENEAFGRLFRYLSGANRTDTGVAMTAPVETREPTAPVASSSGETIHMTAPVETSDPATSTSAGSDEGDGVRMAFFLPQSYDLGSVPTPTDPSVHLVDAPARTLAVLSFSWLTTDGRVARKTDDLLAALATARDLTLVGEPSLLRYDAPWTLPFLRTNEVVVEVRQTERSET